MGSSFEPKHLKACTLILNPQGKLLWANHSALTIFRMSSVADWNPLWRDLFSEFLHPLNEDLNRELNRELKDYHKEDRRDETLYLSIEGSSDEPVSPFFETFDQCYQKVLPQAELRLSGLHLSRLTARNSDEWAIECFFRSRTALPSAEQLPGENEFQELKKVKERYQTFFSQTSEGTWRYEMKTPIPVHLPPAEFIEKALQEAYLAEANPAMAAMYGFESPEEIVGAPISDLVNLNDPANFEYFKHFVESGFRLTNVESVETDRFGKTKYMLNSLLGIVEDGGLIRIWGTQRDITEQKKMHEALQFNEQRFRALMESGGDVIAILDQNGVVKYSSPTALTVLGNNPQDNIGKNVFEHIHPADRGWTKAIFDELVQKGLKKTVISPYRYPHATLGYVWLETVVSDYSDDPSIDGYVVNSRNITERIKLETALRQYTEQLETAQRIARLAYLEYDFKENRYVGSPEVYRMAGIKDPHQEINIELIVSYLPPEEREEMYETISDILRNGTGLNRELTIMLPDGTRRNVAAMGTVVKGIGGEYEKFVLVIQDISDLRSAQQALMSTERKFRYIFDNSADGILLTKPGGLVQNANHAICDLLGYTLEELLQKSRKDIFDFNDPIVQQAIRSRDENGRFKGELKLVHKDGHLIDAEITSVYFKDEDGQSYHSTIVRDITDKKKQREAVIQTQKELQKALFEMNRLLWEKEAAEKKLLISERNLTAVFSNTNESFILLDQELRVVIYNNKAVDYFNQYLLLPIEEGLSYADALPEERKELFLWRMEKVLMGQELIYEIKYDLPRDAWFNVFAKPVFNQEGAITEICLTIAEITYLKQAENRLRETAGQLTHIMESITEGMIILDRNWKITYANQSAERILRIPREAVIGQELWGSVPAFGEDVFQQKLQKVMSAQLAAHFEGFEPVRKRWYELSAYPISSGMSVYFNDITQRRQQQQILALEKQVLEINAVENVSLQSTVHYFIRGFKELMPDLQLGVLGLSDRMTTTDIAIGQMEVELREMLLDKEIEGNDCPCSQSMKTRKPVYNPTLADEFPGKWNPLRISSLQHGYQGMWSLPIVSAQDQVLGCIVCLVRESRLPDELELPFLERASNFLRIIIENKRNEDQIKRSNERYHYVLKATNDAIYDHDIRQGKVFWGDGFTALFGYELNPIKYPNRNQIEFWKSCLHPDDAKRVLHSLEHYLTQSAQKAWQQEYRFLKSNNQYAYVVEKGYLLFDENGEPVRMVGSIQDLTIRKQLEIELLNQELGKQKLVAQAAIDAQEKERAQIGKELHDNINQILTTTKLYLELAKTDEQNRMNLVGRAAQNIVNTIQEIRQLSRSLVPPSIGDLGLVASIADLVENVRIANIIHIEFHALQFDENVIENNLKLMLYRVVQEQVNNVLKHAQAKNLIIELTADQQALRLQLSDDGVGFHPGQIKRGLGLSNISSRANLFNGQVQILSEPGKGCKLIVTIPI
jgi:PAS domain S-box-containing protein